MGCGKGFYENAIGLVHPEWSVVGVDKNQAYLETARQKTVAKNVKYVSADTSRLPFGEEEFEAVICTELLEHLKNDGEVLKEIARVTKKGGVILITVPHKNYPLAWDPINRIGENFFGWHVPAHIWWLAGIWADHVRLYSEAELTRKLEKAGFKIEQLWRGTRWCVPLAHFWLYGIGKNLVEKGWLPDFDRFNYSPKTGWLAQGVRGVFNLFDRLNKVWPEEPGKPYLNIIVKCRKADGGRK